MSWLSLPYMYMYILVTFSIPSPVQTFTIERRPTALRLFITSNYEMSSIFPTEVLLEVAQRLDCNGQYALLRAHPVLAGRFSYRRHLLAKKDDSGNNLVHILAQNGEEALLKSLFPDEILENRLRSGNVTLHPKQAFLTRSTNDEGATPIDLAAEKGHLAIVDWIAKCPGVNLNCKDNEGMTCVGRAARAGQADVVNLLLSSPNLTTDWNTRYHQSNPLCLAAEHGHIETLKVILERYGERINVNSRGFWGFTALGLAVLRKREEIVDMLLQKGDTDVNTSNGNGSALHLAVQSENYAALKLLLAHPDINPNVQNARDNTPLQEAVYAGDKVSVRLLLEHPRTDVNLGNLARVTPLIMAVQECHIKIVRLLLKRSDIHADQKDRCGMTAFAWAAFLGRSRIAKMLLLRPDVDLNSRDGDGVTPLGLSVKAGSEDIAAFLLCRPDIDINATDDFGWTALAHAKCAPGGISNFLMHTLLNSGATMDPHPEIQVMSDSTYPDIAVDMVRAMVAGRDLQAYMVQRFGQGRTDAALGDGQHGVRRLLFRDTDVKRMRLQLVQSIRYQEKPA
jgi:ankyrin repeat protein